MTTSKCFSSQMMSQLLTWRNPQGAEKKWMKETQQVNDCCEFIGKAASTEIGLCLLATTSSVETVAYATFLVPAFCLQSISNKPYNLILERLESGVVTTVWSVADLYYNLFTMNLYTEEETVLKLI